MTTFMEQALVFIGAAVVLVPLFKLLGLGSVLGYLIAGLIVGPQGLKLIQDSESVMHFSELGVVLLLFLIGLEIQPRKLWSMRLHLLGLGGLQVAITTVIFALIALFFGLSILASCVVGFALSLSSTAFALQTLVEKNHFNTEFGRASFSVLLMQDLLAIPALALIPAASLVKTQPSSFNPVVLALFIVVILVISRRFLIRPLFRVIASSNMREIFTAATLFIVLGVAALMANAGLSAALGTFIAGVLLADSEYRHELEANLEPFKSLLMGLFFIAVGMSVDLRFILDQTVLVFACALTYLTLKALIIYGVGRLFKLNHLNAKQMALTIAQGGEFAFVILGMVLTLNLGASGMVSFLTVVITLSMAFSPLLMMLNDWISRKRQKGINRPAFDAIKDEAPEVIIAGFGRFGQIFGRILRAQNIRFVAIDHDPERVEAVRKFGSVVYYGDSSRHDLLEAAGAAKAKYFIVAVDDPELSLRTVQVVSEHYKHLKIFARARDRGHAFDLMALGIKTIKREMFDSSMNFARDLLVDMGYSPERVATLIEKFKLHDEIMLEEQFKVRHDDKKFVSVSKQALEQLTQVLSDDTKQGYISR